MLVADGGPVASRDVGRVAHDGQAQGRIHAKRDRCAGVGITEQRLKASKNTVVDDGAVVVLDDVTFLVDEECARTGLAGGLRPRVGAPEDLAVVGADVSDLCGTTTRRILTETGNGLIVGRITGR